MDYNIEGESHQILGQSNLVRLSLLFYPERDFVGNAMLGCIEKINIVDVSYFSSLHRICKYTGAGNKTTFQIIIPMQLYDVNTCIFSRINKA